ncbi:unnamed protein product [Brassica rapa subsp. narinosa]
MGNFSLASLPPSMLHKILSKVAITSLRDFGKHSGLDATNKVIQRSSTYEVYMNTSSSIYLMKEGKKIILLVREDAYGMMNLAFSVDHRGLVHNYPAFTREYVDQMYHEIDRNVSYDCWCSAIIEPVFVVSIDGSRTRWKCDRCFWQCAASDFCNEIHLTACDWPIED